MTNTTTQASASARALAARTCRHCGEDEIDHCHDCGACPDQECPAWCEPAED